MPPGWPRGGTTRKAPGRKGEATLKRRYTLRETAVCLGEFRG